MSDKPGVLQTMKTDATDASWRTAGKQFTKLARDPLAALLARHLGPDDDALRARIARFMETEIGTALLASLLSVGLSAMPDMAGEVPQRLARELRVSAMADASGVVADVFSGPLREIMATTLRGVPEITVAAGLGDGARLRSAQVVDLGEKVEAKRGA
jgi:hypothetical protein